MTAERGAHHPPAPPAAQGPGNLVSQGGKLGVKVSVPGRLRSRGRGLKATGQQRLGEPQMERLGQQELKSEEKEFLAKKGGLNG